MIASPQAAGWTGFTARPGARIAQSAAQNYGRNRAEPGPTMRSKGVAPGKAGCLNETSQFYTDRFVARRRPLEGNPEGSKAGTLLQGSHRALSVRGRSEERRVGKECL